MSEELKPAVPEGGTEQNAEKPHERMPEHSEVVKKAELERYADPKDPKDPKEQQEYDDNQIKKQAIEEDTKKFERQKKNIQNSMQGIPDR